jgi:O-antigen/teichoic acid export membrane protein
MPIWRIALAPALRALPLILISLTEYLTPFLRMMALSHGLSLLELGFASVLTATYGTFESITDFALSRFIFSASRDEYDKALASAHALALLRGFVVGGLTTIAAPMVATAMGLSQSWLDFAVLGPVVLIRSFEHLGPRVAERDYRYGTQLSVALVANLCGLSALVAAVLITHSHIAFVIGLYTQMTAQVICSHLFADGRYRLSFRSPWLKKAFAFGLPLTINGMGLAASGQGDRFIIAGMLGLPAVGVYAVTIMATTVPLAMINRITGTTLMAALYNSINADARAHTARVRLAAQLLPMLSAINGMGILMLLNLMAPLVFGKQFHLSPMALIILTFACFVREIRGDPFSSMMINQGQTRRLAATNLSSITALPFEFILVAAFSSFEAALAGRLMGEIVALIVTLKLTYADFKPAMPAYAVAFSAALALVSAAAAVTLTTSAGEAWLPSLAALAIGIPTAVGLAALLSHTTIRIAFPRLMSAHPRVA